MNDGKTKSETAMYPRRTRIRLTKAIENVRQKLFTDAHARITDNNLDMRIDALELHLDLPAFGRELHGVAQEVPDDLLQTIGVPGDRTSLRIQQRLQADALCLSGGTN